MRRIFLLAEYLVILNWNVAKQTRNSTCSYILTHCSLYMAWSSFIDIWALSVYFWWLLKKNPGCLFPTDWICVVASWNYKCSLHCTRDYTIHVDHLNTFMFSFISRKSKDDQQERVQVSGMLNVIVNTLLTLICIS